MAISHLLVVLLLLLVLGASELRGVAAKGGHIYMDTFDLHSSGNNNTILSVDPSTGKILPLTPFSLSVRTTDFAMDPVRALYHLFVGSGSSYSIFTFNASRADVTQLIGRTDIALQSFMGTQCDPQTGNIVGVAMTSSSVSLVLVSPTFGSVTKLASLPDDVGVILDASAFDSNNRIYYQLVNRNRTSILYKLDLRSNKLSFVQLDEDVLYMTFDSQKGRLLGHPFHSGGYAAVDTDTGHITPVIKMLPGIPDTITIDPTAQILYATVDYFGDDSLVIFDLQTGAQLNKFHIPWDVRFSAFFPH